MEVVLVMYVSVGHAHLRGERAVNWPDRPRRKETVALASGRHGSELPGPLIVTGVHWTAGGIPEITLGAPTGQEISPEQLAACERAGWIFASNR